MTRKEVTLEGEAYGVRYSLLNGKSRTKFFLRLEDFSLRTIVYDGSMLYLAQGQRVKVVGEDCTTLSSQGHPVVMAKSVTYLGVW